MPHPAPTVTEPAQQVPFLLVGVTHHGAPVAVREQFALSQPQQIELLHRLKALGAESPLVISTCNRTQVFCRQADVHQVVHTLCQLRSVPHELFWQHGEVLHCRPALERLFDIAAGLDSQILGDLQIVKQVKEAYQLTCDQHLADAMLHRIVQHVVRAHKRIRSETNLGKGAASVAGAAVQFVTREVGTLHDKRILLVGAGKMGKVTCANLQSYSPAEITLVNRTKARAQRLGKRYTNAPGVRVSGFDNLAAEFAWADVVIVATGSQQYVLRPEHLRCPAVGRKVVVDLSVPRNIDPAVGDLPNVLLADLDTLQSTTDSAYQERLQAVPQAHALVAHELANYEHWQAAQRVAPTIRALHDKFDTIRRQEMDLVRHKLSAPQFDVLERITERIVRKIAAHSIDHLRATPADAESVAELLREMFKLEATDTVATAADVQGLAEPAAVRA